MYLKEIFDKLSQPPAPHPLCPAQGAKQPFEEAESVSYTAFFVVLGYKIGVGRRGCSMPKMIPKISTSQSLEPCTLYENKKSLQV